MSIVKISRIISDEITLPAQSSMTIIDMPFSPQFGVYRYYELIPIPERHFEYGDRIDPAQFVLECYLTETVGDIILFLMYTQLIVRLKLVIVSDGIKYYAHSYAESIYSNQSGIVSTPTADAGWVVSNYIDRIKLVGRNRYTSGIAKVYPIIWTLYGYK